MKTGTKNFASATSSAPSTAQKTITNRTQTNCVVRRKTHPLWRCHVFLTERAKVVADSKLCFSCLKGNHSFRQGTAPRKCSKNECFSSRNTLIHGAERTFAAETTPKPTRNKVTGSQSLNITETKSKERTGICSVTDVKGLIQIVEVQVLTATLYHKVLALCDSACSHSCGSQNIASKLKLKGSPTKLTVHGINSHPKCD